MKKVGHYIGKTKQCCTKKLKSLLLFSTQFLERVHIMENNIALLFFFEGAMLVSIFRAVEKSTSIFAYLKYKYTVVIRGRRGKAKKGKSRSNWRQFISKYPSRYHRTWPRTNPAPASL